MLLVVWPPPFDHPIYIANLVEKKRDLLRFARSSREVRGVTSFGRLPSRFAAYSKTRNGWMPTERPWLRTPDRRPIGMKPHRLVAGRDEMAAEFLQQLRLGVHPPEIHQDTVA
jgi:hypothetical protein